MRGTLKRFDLNSLVSAGGDSLPVPRELGRFRRLEELNKEPITFESLRNAGLSFLTACLQEKSSSFLQTMSSKITSSDASTLEAAYSFLTKRKPGPSLEQE